MYYCYTELVHRTFKMTKETKPNNAVYDSTLRLFTFKYAIISNT